jgi:phage terminase small subunit
MNDQTPSLSPRPLSPRHERFVAEYLKDGNATRAYIRAGYATRGAQPSASRLLRDPRIAAAIAASRQGIAQTLAVSLERVTQEYAKIAFASIDDFVSTDDDGRLRVDLEKAHQAQRAGIVELKIASNSKQEQQVTLKLAKLQALAALSKQLGGQVAKPDPASALDGLGDDLHNARLRHQAEERAERAERALAEAQAALAAAQAPDGRPPDAPPQPAPQVEVPTEPPSEEAAAPQGPSAMAGMPTQPLPDHVPGLYPNARFVWSGGREHGLGPDSADALRVMKPGGFPGW